MPAVFTTLVHFATSRAGRRGSAPAARRRLEAFAGHAVFHFLGRHDAVDLSRFQSATMSWRQALGTKPRTTAPLRSPAPCRLRAVCGAALLRVVVVTPIPRSRFVFQLRTMAASTRT